MAKYRILSLDGGGIRGVLTARLLERIQEQLPWFMDSIDLIAGTSTGGILALALASGKTPSEVREMYEELGTEVFRTERLPFQELAQMVTAHYSNQPLHTLLQNVLDDKTLGDLKPNVLITSFQLDSKISQQERPRTWKAKFFHNFQTPDPARNDRKERAIDIAVRTSAAPTYFPLYEGFVDGGVVANNPSMCALAQAIQDQTGGQRLTDIALFSVGTGNFPHYLAEQNDSWGLFQWAPHLISLMMEGNSGLADYQCQQLLGSRYYRLNPVMERNVDLDKVQEVPYLVDVVNLEIINPAIDWLEKNFKPKKKLPPRKTQ